MSASALYPGGLVEPSYVVLTGAGQTDVFTATGNFTVLSGATIVNASGGSVDVILEYYNGTTDIKFYKGTIADKVTVTVEYPQFPMRSGNKIKATGASGITVFLTLSRTQSGAPSNSPSV
jgi:hypothetical protein